MTSRNICMLIVLGLFLTFTFTGQSQVANQLKFRVRLDYTMNTGNRTMKGYIERELRKIPEVILVNQDERFRISIVALELTDPPQQIVYSCSILERFNAGHLSYLTKADLDRVRRDTRFLYFSINNYVGIFPRDILQSRCEDLAVQFDTDALSPYRKLLNN